MNEPNGSTGTAGAGWRDEILREFTPGVVRLTVVDDPDGLLAETGMVEALRARGFEVVPAADRVAFRYFWESRYRSRRDPGELADGVAVFTAARHEHVVPYDLLHASRRLSFSLADLFPRLNWAVVEGMNPSDLDALHAAQAQEPPKRPLDPYRTRRFVLRHVFGITPETIRQVPALLGVLLRLHYRRLRLTWDIERHLVDALRRKSAFRPWPLTQIVSDPDAFLAFLQGAAAQAQIARRMAESWGERTTATRAVQRIVRSFVEWGVLVETGDRGTYAPAARIPVAGAGPWLLEAGLVSSGRREYPFRALAAGAAFYPFDMTLSGQDIGGNPRLEICRQGLDEDVVMLSAVRRTD